MSIVRHQQKKIMHLTASNAEIYQAVQGSPVRHMQRPESYDAIKGLIKIAIVELGYNLATEDLDTLIVGVANDIYRDFQDYTLEDIALAFRMGVRGELGQFMGASIVSFYGWLKTYRPLRQKAQMDYLKNLPPAEAKPKTQEELDRDRVEYIKTCILRPYQRYLDGDRSEPNNMGGVVYDYLRQLDLITVPVKRRYALLDKAREIIKLEVIQNSEKTAIAKALKDIDRGQDPGQEAVILVRAKTLTMLEQFSQWAEMEEDLVAIMEEVTGLTLSTNTNK